MDDMAPRQKMAALGILQEGDQLLAEVARRFDLPAEAEDARRVLTELVSTIDRLNEAHSFTKGLGLAAPQIGIGRAAAVTQSPNGHLITLLNPRIVAESATTDDHYEGCFSFFDVRGIVRRPDAIEVKHQDVHGRTLISEFTGAEARLVCHQVDHLFGMLYWSQMRPGSKPIPVAQLNRTGLHWPF
jgi:peptide deformylase